MNRLTDRSKEIPLPCTDNAAFWARVHEKLARYEDSGLEPEQCAKYAQAEKEGRYIVLKEPRSAGVHRLEEIARADIEGRLLVLPCATGEESWVVERDEDGCAVDVSCYMFLAKAGDAVILTAYVNDLPNVQETLAYHMMETAANYGTDLAVFPANDCYTTREDAEKALEGMKNEL